MPQKSNTEQFIQKAKIKHGDKYDYSKVNYNGRSAPVTIICPKHGEFKQTPHDHLDGCGCPSCYSEKRKQPKSSFENFKELANKIHNKKYDYSQAEYNGVAKKIKIICPIHGEFMQAPQNHLHGQGCPQCGNERKGSYAKSNTEKFVNKAKEVHGDKYDYSKVEYINNRIKVCIICPEHGEFIQKPLDHLHGCGCPECGKRLDKSEKFVLNALRERYGDVSYQYTEPWLQSRTSFQSLDFFLPAHKVGIEYQGRQHFEPIKKFGGEAGYALIQNRDKRKYEQCKSHGIPVFYISFEKNIPVDYFAPIYKTTDDLFNAIDIYIKQKENNTMTTLNENTLRKLIRERVISLMENYADEYRTKGALNKKTLEKNAGKSAEEIIADRQAKAEDDELASRWADTEEDILNKFRDPEEFDDSKAGGDYQINFSDPYFFTKDGERVDADAIGNFHNDFAIVKKDGKCNFINSEGKVISDEWFDACNDFESGFGLVVKGGKKNFVGSNGELLLDIWADRAGDFMGSRAPIIINGERHEVDYNGTIY